MKSLARIGLLILMAVALLALTGCTFVYSPGVGVYLSVLQRKSGTMAKTSDTLAIHYNTDSQAAENVLLQGIALGQQLAGAAGKAAIK